MMLAGKMKDLVDVFRRTDRESTDYTELYSDVPALISEPNADARKRELGDHVLDVTHLARMPEYVMDELKNGDRVRRNSTNEEWLVHSRKLVTRGERHTKAWLSLARPTTQA